MQTLERCLLLLLLTLAAPWPLGALDYLFVFHAGSTATVYDADSFELLGTPLGASNPYGIAAQQAMGRHSVHTPLLSG